MNVIIANLITIYSLSYILASCLNGEWMDSAWSNFMIRNYAL